MSAVFTGRCSDEYHQDDMAVSANRGAHRDVKVVAMDVRLKIITLVHETSSGLFCIITILKRSAATFSTFFALHIRTDGATKYAFLVFIQKFKLLSHADNMTIPMIKNYLYGDTTRALMNEFCPNTAAC